MRITSISIITALLLLPLLWSTAALALPGTPAQARLKTQMEIINEVTPHVEEGAGKCGLWLSFHIQENRERFSKEEQSLLLSPPELQTSRVVGRFRIHYDTSGVNGPSLLNGEGDPMAGTADAYIDSAGKVFNEVWEYETGTLGYDAPPLEADSSYYNIYVTELGTFFYGQTQFVAQVTPGDSRYTTFIEIDNDYRAFFSSGMNGLKVTAAHEFHHAIQVGSYRYLPNDLSFYEMTSTWMEDVVYPHINDYYQYLKTGGGSPRGHFATPDSGFTCSSGDIPYSRAIWGKFIEQRYSPEVMRLAWEVMRSTSSIAALDQALATISSNFRQAFVEFSLWNAKTGPACDTALYYSEGRDYPLIRTRPDIAYIPPGARFDDSLKPVSSSYRSVCVLSSQDESCDTSSRMLVVVSNIDSVFAYTQQWNYFSYVMQDGPSDPSYRRLENGLFVRLDVLKPGLWAAEELLPVSTGVEAGETPLAMSLGHNFPNPFNPTTNLRFTIADLRFVSLKVYNVLGEEVAELVNEMKEPGVYALSWDGAGVPSGIYFYRLQAGSFSETKKLVLLR